MSIASLAIACLFAVLSFIPAARAAPDPPAVTRGPASGTLIAVGGGTVTDAMVERFMTAAGGAGAPVVVIPTAVPDRALNLARTMERRLTDAGATVTIVHTRDHAIANSDDFLAPLEAARGVWFTGGRQWRTMEAYLGTRVHDALRGVLERGGVIGGTSAGATVQASYLVRGARENNEIMMAPKFEVGFGFLAHAAIDQHLSQRERVRDLLPVIDAHPELLGIGIDESTAIVVAGDELEVIGRGRVAIYDHAALTAETNPRRTPQWLTPGTQFDLAARQRVVRVATDATFPPFHYVREDGSIDGFDVAVARAALERAGLSSRVIRTNTYRALFDGLAARRHDLVAATTGITPERERLYAFSSPYFSTGQYVVVRRVSSITDPAQLAGRIVRAAAGTTSERAARALGATLATFDKDAPASDSATMLRTERVDAIIADEFEARAIAAAHDDLRLLDAPAAAEQYGFVLRRVDADLAQRVSNALESMRTDGTLAALREQYGVHRK